MIHGAFIISQENNEPELCTDVHVSGINTNQHNDEQENVVDEDTSASINTSTNNDNDNNNSACYHFPGQKCQRCGYWDESNNDSESKIDELPEQESAVIYTHKDVEQVYQKRARKQRDIENVDRDEGELEQKYAQLIDDHEHVNDTPKPQEVDNNATGWEPGCTQDEHDVRLETTKLRENFDEIKQKMKLAGFVAKKGIPTTIHENQSIDSQYGFENPSSYDMSATITRYP